MDVNQFEIGLLREDPGELIVKYQPIVIVIVQVYMRSGYFRGEEKEEIVQQINEKLLERIEKIRQQYNGMAQLRTYFSAVIRNLCLEIIRKGRNRDVLRLVEEYDHNLSYSPDQLNRMIIDQELQRLDLILAMFHKLKSKLVISFKAMLRMPLHEDDLLDYCKERDISEIEKEYEILMAGEAKNDKEVYRQLTVLFNYIECKNNSLDAVRKWVWIREEEVLKMLNGDPPRANHNHETLMILLERYFTEEQFKRPVFHLKISAPL